MDRKRSSLVIGSRTRTNVLKGKNIRKHNDGADNFADYWTDSDTEDSSSSISDKCSYLPKTLQASNISRNRFETLKQNVKTKNSNVSNSVANISDKDQSKFTKSTLKSAKNVLSWKKDVPRSSSKEQKLFPKHRPLHTQLQYSNEISINTSALSNDGLDENRSNVSSNCFQHSNSNVRWGQTENVAVSPLAKINHKENALIRPNDVQVSGNLNGEEDNIQLNTSKHTANAIRLNEESTASPSTSESSEKEKTSFSPRTSPRLKKFNEFNNKGKQSSISQIQTYDVNDLSIHTENAISSVSKESDKSKKMFVMDENIPKANFNTSDIHVVSSTKIITAETDSVDAAVSEAHALSDKTFNETNNLVGHEDEEQVSKVFRTSFGNLTVKKMRKSLQVSKSFAKYDEYDAEIMQMVCESEKKHSLRSSSMHMPAKKKIAEPSTSENNTGSAEEVSDRIASKETEINSSKTLKSSNVSLSNKKHKTDKQITSVDNRRKKYLNKTYEKEKASETFSLVNSDTEISAKENRSVRNLNVKRKIHFNKTNKKLKTSKTFSKQNNSSTAIIPEKGNEFAQNPDNGEKKHRNKSWEKLKASETFSKNIENTTEIPEVENCRPASNLHNKRKKHANKTNDEMNATETFSNGNKSADEIPEVENRTTSNVDKKRKPVNEKDKSLSHKKDNDQHPLSPHKKKSKKRAAINATEDTVPIRKSSRQKFPPLATWRNERPLYRCVDGIINFIGIDQGTEEDNGAIQQIMKNKKRKNIEKKQRAKRFDLNDIVTNKNVRVSLLKRFNDINWDKGFQSDDCPYRIKKMFETPSSASGFIQIEINEEKPTQYMPNEDIYLTVVKGKVEIVVQQDIRVVCEKDMFIIPRCIPYSIRNIGYIRALLVFCVGRFQYMESQA